MNTLSEKCLFLISILVLTSLIFSFFVSAEDSELIILKVESNISYSCGVEEIARIICEIENSSEIDLVKIESHTPSDTLNYSTNLLENNTYYSDISLNEVGNWSFNCIVNDIEGGQTSLFSDPVNVYSILPNLKVSSSKIYFSNENPIEKEEILISSIIQNKGCSPAENFTVGFFEEDPDANGLNLENFTLTLEDLDEQEVNFSWSAKIGPTNLFIYADSLNEIEEFDKTNNKANKTINVNAWQVFYGNVSVEKILSDQELKKIGAWSNKSLFGNIFVADKEATIDWSSLQALGKDIHGNSNLEDFEELDMIFGMEDFKDSISNLFLNNNSEISKTEDFFIHGQKIEDVPIINSTENSNFVTGILWDTSTDTDGVFGSIDLEDIVFITKIIKFEEGAYGNYDYEITVPVKLREYYDEDIKDLFIYFDLP